MAGDAGADRQVGASFLEEFADFGIDGHEMGQRMKDGGLSADTVGVNIGASVDIGTAFEAEASGIKEPIFAAAT